MKHNSGFPSKTALDCVRVLYPYGSRVELVSMDDPYTTLKPGDRGTVQFVDDALGIHIKWDNGSSLAAIHGVDRLKKI
ncbi:hypothetical protein FACS1894132_02180 [Clostridia bacterium]|nr:hypothetical protein FACS1894132_02180 [Clostridia bacterium]